VVTGVKFNAVSIFRPEESEYQKYSAILAATEPLRLKCEEDIKKVVNPLVLLYHQLTGDIYFKSLNMFSIIIIF
jgi:hypothetical protein